jgi:large subunit ribosomal protein L4
MKGLGRSRVQSLLKVDPWCAALHVKLHHKKVEVKQEFEVCEPRSSEEVLSLDVGYAVHGPRPHIKTTDIQRKLYDAGIRHALSTKYKQKQLVVVDKLFMNDLSKSKLKEHLEKLDLLGKKVYFLYGSPISNSVMVRSMDSFTKKKKTSQNPTGEKPLLVTHANHVSVWTLLEYDYVVMDKEAVEAVELKYGQ